MTPGGSHHTKQPHVTHPATGAGSGRQTGESGSSRYGTLVDNSVPVSLAVAASAAYPVFLPAWSSLGLSSKRWIAHVRTNAPHRRWCLRQPSYELPPTRSRPRIQYERASRRADTRLVETCLTSRRVSRPPLVWSCSGSESPHRRES
jgi:hypothetical protein